MGSQTLVCPSPLWRGLGERAVHNSLKGREERKKEREREGEGPSKVHVRKMIGGGGRKIEGLVCWTALTFSASLHQLHSQAGTEALHRGEEGKEG